MSILESTLRAGTIALDSRNLREVLQSLASTSGLRFHLTSESTIAIGADLSPLDRRALAVELTLAPRTLVLRGEAVVVRWLARHLARLLAAQTADSSAPFDAALHAFLHAHEAPYLEEPASPSVHVGGDDPAVKTVLELVQLGRILLVSGAAPQLAELVRASTSTEQLYEALLESDFVEDVFLSESELAQALR